MDDQMKNQQRYSRPKKPWLIPLCLIAAGIAGCVLWAALGAKSDPPEPDWQARPGQMQEQFAPGQNTDPQPGNTQPLTSPTPESQEPNESEQADSFPVETPFFTVELPAYLKDAIKLEDSTDGGYALRCYGTAEEKSYLLFDFSVGGKGENPLGILESGGAKYPVFAEVYPLPEDHSLSEDSCKLLLAIQEEVNTFLTAVYALPGFRYESSTLPEETVNLGAVTSYGTLTVPAVWEEHMWAAAEPEVGGESVTFFALVAQQELPLYTVLIGADPTGADLIGFITLPGSIKTPVSLLLYDCPTGSDYTDADRDKFLAMQEEVNHTLAELSGWTGFAPT